jgi:hypothetical protein
MWTDDRFFLWQLNKLCQWVKGCFHEENPSPSGLRLVIFQCHQMKLISFICFPILKILFPIQKSKAVEIFKRCYLHICPVVLCYFSLCSLPGCWKENSLTEEWMSYVYYRLTVSFRISYLTNWQISICFMMTQLLTMLKCNALKPWTQNFAKQLLLFSCHRTE